MARRWPVVHGGPGLPARRHCRGPEALYRGAGRHGASRGLGPQRHRGPRTAGVGPVALWRALRRVDRGEADRLTRIAVGDFEFVLQASQSHWDKLSEHGRGEMLGALADGWLMLGETAKADVFLARMTSELPGTAYAKNAAQRRADPSPHAAHLPRLPLSVSAAGTPGRPSRRDCPTRRRATGRSRRPPAGSGR